MKSSIDKKVLITGMIVVGVIIVVLILVGYLRSISAYNTISSTGESTIKVLPDLVSVYFSIQTTGSTAEIASDKNSEVYEKMKSSLIALGFSEEEIETQSFSVYPNYDWTNGNQRITGYSASHSVIVQIEVSEKDKIGKVIDAGIGSGAGIGYINYELTKENQSKYKLEAIKAATQDATTKAEAIAEGAGQSLGKLISISTNEFGYSPWLAYSGADSGSGTIPAKSGAEIATSITPSEQEVSARITAIFRIR